MGWFRDLLPGLLPLCCLSCLLPAGPEQLVHHLHSTEVPAHRAGIGLAIPLMDLPGMLPIQSEPELFVPVEVMPGLRHPHLALHPEPFGPADGVADMGCNLRDPGALDNIRNIRQGEVLARRDHAEEVGAVQAGCCPANRCDHVVVARGDVGDERAEEVEWGMIGDLLDHPDIVAHLIEGHVAGALDHPLDAGSMRPLGEQAEGVVLH